MVHSRPLRVQIQNPFYLMFLPRKYFCKTRTLVLVKKAKTPQQFPFAGCDENATNPYILPVTQNTGISC